MVIAGAIQKFGPVDLVVSWIHSTAPNAAFEIARLVTREAARVAFYDVLGSATLDPANAKLFTEKVKKFAALSNLNYRAVVLGFVIENEKSRWLTRNEISTGVLAAIASDAELFMVGTTEPWSSRP